MASRMTALREGNPLPPGTVAVGAGLAVTGLASYAYLVVSARVLGPEQSGSLSVLWALVFMLGGLFLPLEQEVSRRLVGRRIAGLGGRSIVRRALALGAVAVAALVLAFAVFAPVLTRRIFNGQGLLVVGLMLGSAGYMVANWTEGTLSGWGRFGRYGGYLGGEATLRLSICLVLLAVGVRTAGPVGLALGIAPLVVAVPALWWRRDTTVAEPEVAWRDLAAGLGVLLAAALLAQLLINASPVLLQVLVGPGNAAEVGIFTAALVVARVPLFLFQALQAVLLPALAALAVAGRFDEFRVGVRRMVVVVAVLGGVAVLCALAFGPQLILRVYGPQYPVDRRTIVLLTAASACYLLASTLAQALIAVGQARKVAFGWGTGVVALALVVVVGNDPLLTVELAFLTATAVSVVAMALFLRQSLRAGDRPSTDTLLEAANDIALEA